MHNLVKEGSIQRDKHARPSQAQYTQSEATHTTHDDNNNHSTISQLEAPAWPWAQITSYRMDNGRGADG